MKQHRIRTYVAMFILAALTCSGAALAQDGKMYPIDAPKEPNAIPLGTGGVKDQPAKP